MTLSPFEVERREFGRTAMGYKTREVDTFVDDVHRSLSQLWQERGELREENERVRERLTRFEQIEEQLKNTLLLAQDSAEKAHEQARRESELLLREAGQKARDIVNAAHEEKQRLETSVRDLASAEQETRQRMRSLSQTVLGHLEDTESLLPDTSTTLRAKVQAQPEMSELRTGTTGKQPRAEAAKHEAEDAKPGDAKPAKRVPAAKRSADLRHMAKSKAADDFFEDPPSFDRSEVAPPRRRSEPVTIVE